MKSILALASMACLVAAQPVLAQDASRQGRSVSDWSRVRTLAADTGIVVSTPASPPLRRYVVGADEAWLMVSRTMGDRDHVIERIARHDVRSISIRRKGRGFWGHLGPIGGYFVGALAGGFVAGLACPALSAESGCDTGPFLIGAAIGGISGTAYGLHAARRETETVIYRAPF